MPPPTVLLVDDDLVLLELATRILVAEGYTVIAAPSAEEALAVAAEAEVVDLLFSDVVLPGRTGIELALTLRDERPDLPVLLTTGDRSGELSAAIDRAGLHLLRKPYDIPDVLAAVRRAMAEPDPGSAAAS